jgi:hypothetical protein
MPSTARGEEERDGERKGASSPRCRHGNGRAKMNGERVGDGEVALGAAAPAHGATWKRGGRSRERRGEPGLKSVRGGRTCEGGSRGRELIAVLLALWVQAVGEEGWVDRWGSPARDGTRRRASVRAQEGSEQARVGHRKGAQCARRRGRRPSGWASSAGSTHAGGGAGSALGLGERWASQARQRARTPRAGSWQAGRVGCMIGGPRKERGARPRRGVRERLRGKARASGPRRRRRGWLGHGGGGAGWAGFVFPLFICFHLPYLFSFLSV